jgi:hypothetical protein
MSEINPTQIRATDEATGFRPAPGQMSKSLLRVTRLLKADRAFPSKL